MFRNAGKPFLNAPRAASVRSLWELTHPGFEKVLVEAARTQTSILQRPSLLLWFAVPAAGTDLGSQYARAGLVVLTIQYS